MLKDRPCAIVLAVKQEGETKVYVLPITHAAPTSSDDAVELPAPVKARLGLDDQPSWIAVTETNGFIWSGPDLRFVPGKGPESLEIGLLPPELFRIMRNRFAGGSEAGERTWRGGQSKSCGQ